MMGLMEDQFKNQALFFIVTDDITVASYLLRIQWVHRVKKVLKILIVLAQTTQLMDQK